MSKIFRSPPYYREVWDFKNTKTTCIQKQYQTSAGQGRSTVKIPKERVKCKILTETYRDIFCNFVPNKIKKFDYRIPEWMNKSFRLSLKKRSKFTKRYPNNSPSYSQEALFNVQH